VLLDLGLPDMDGTDVCRAIRTTSAVPIIVVSARDDEIDRVLALEMGADDYVVKPFGMRELVARIRAVSRRSAPATQPLTTSTPADAAPQPVTNHTDSSGSADIAGPASAAVSADSVGADSVGADSVGAASSARPERQFGPLFIDIRSQRITLENEPLHLTAKEFELLAYLSADPGAVFRRADILHDVWDTNWYGTTKTLDTHIAAIRKKLGDPGWIESVRGVGFRFGQPQ
jgi:DNA-binding response OmpR family regulator